MAQLSKAFEQEIETLTNSYQQLSTAVKKFNDSKIVLGYLKEKSQDKDIMVPLTSSLYIQGRMEESNKVLMEVGAGYFIESSTGKAQEYCDRKIKTITDNVNKVAEIV